jgi:hypothetical protein
MRRRLLLRLAAGLLWLADRIRVVLSPGGGRAHLIGRRLVAPALVGVEPQTLTVRWHSKGGNACAPRPALAGLFGAGKRREFISFAVADCCCGKRAPASCRRLPP